MRDAEVVTILVLIGTISRVSSSSNSTSPFQRVPRWRRHLLPSFLEHRTHGSVVDHQGHHQQQQNPPPHRDPQINNYDNQNIYPSVTFANPPLKWGYIDDSENFNSVTTIKLFETDDYLYENTKTTSNVFEYRPYTTYYNPDSSTYKSSIFNEISYDNEIDFEDSLKFTRSTNLLASPSALGNTAAQILTQFIPNHSVKYQATTVPFSQISQTYIKPIPSNTNNNVGRPVLSLCFPSTVTDIKIHYVTTNKITTITVCPANSALDDYLRPVSIPRETIKVYSTITYTIPQNTVTICPVFPVNDYLTPISVPINDYLPPINTKTFTTSLTKYSTIISTLPATTVIDVETTTTFKTSTSYLTSKQTETISITSIKTSTAYVRDIQTVTETQPPQTIEVTITSQEFFISTVFQPVVEYVTEIQTQYSQYCGGYGYKIPSSSFIN